MDIQDDLVKFQEYLINEYQRFAEKRRRGSRRTDMPSEAQFAKYLGVSPTTLSSWMTGIRKPDYGSCLHLSQTLGLRVFEACGFAPAVMVTDSKLMQIIDMWRLLTHDEIEQIVEYAERIRQPDGKAGGDME